MFSPFTTAQREPAGIRQQPACGCVPAAGGASDPIAMDLVSWLVFGLLAGATAKLIMPGKDPGGCLVTIAIGITGSVIGGAISEHLLGYGRVEGFTLRSLGLAILGSILLLTLYRLFLLRRPRR